MTDLAERRGVETTVYQPAEDSHLLATTAVEAVEREDLVLDVGTGSGYVAARLAEASGTTVVGCDLNPEACRAARAHGVEAVRCDLVGAFRDAAFDVVVCNPPYLPELPEAARDDWMEVALTAGEDGRAVVDPLLDDLGRVLRPDGAAYLLVSTLTGVDEVLAYARERGLSGAVVAEESFPFETLVVLELRRA